MNNREYSIRSSLDIPLGEEILIFYEFLRSLIIQSEELRKRILNVSDVRLKEFFLEHLETCQADLLEFYNLLYDLINCNNQDDFNYIISLNWNEKDGRCSM